MCTLFPNSVCVCVCASLLTFMPASVCVCIYKCAYVCVCVCGLLLKVHIHPVRPSGGQELAKRTTERLLCDRPEAVSAPSGETLKNVLVKNPISACNI